MGYSIGYDSRWNRDIGYGVPAFCDHPGCGKEIDRGLAYVCCGEQPHGGEDGCGLYFCDEHKFYHSKKGMCCKRCSTGKKPFEPVFEHPAWTAHKLTDPSWQKWREENPEQVEKLRSRCEHSISTLST